MSFVEPDRQIRLASNVSTRSFDLTGMALSALAVVLFLVTPFIALVWQALGEFGATIMFAGNFQSRNQTMPLAIYLRLQQELPAALTLSAILLVVSFSLLILVRLITGKEQVHA
ncbi:MAG: hypothetical protein JXA42_07445 [Anaerolineales bacterium]|nr:hypothetical protein [Anaerolineales bacterium]